jgi:outer membrane protein assembly factor BamB
MRHFSATMIALLTVSVSARAENWPGWRGPRGTGISAETGLPVNWSRTDNVRWKVPVPGAGVSAPVVWGDHIFLTASDGRLNDRLHVYCYHRNDGKQLWNTRLFGSAPTDLFAPGGMAVPTPVTDGKHVHCLFGTGDLVCLDFAGKPVWIRSLAEEYGPFRNRWGMGTSPILLGDLLIVQVDHWSQSYLLGVEAKTGANRWKTDRAESVNWTTPLAVKVKDRTEILVLGTNRAKGYDADNGAELWSVNGLHFQCIPTPVVVGDLAIVCSGENTMAVRLDGSTGDLTKSNVVWLNKKAGAFLPSPVAYENYVYVTGDKGICLCLDAAKGTIAGKKRLGEQFHASPVAGDGKLYFASKEGVVRVVRSGPQMEILAENDVGEEIIASPAISNRQIFLRGAQHLFCIEERK